jgi:hypothetical protein
LASFWIADSTDLSVKTSIPTSEPSYCSEMPVDFCNYKQKLRQRIKRREGSCVEREE